ncbi:plastocyanin/azurin family copper-binding protein [Rhizobium leguminosarum]|uniref:Blue (type 1) copper domain-containing protein n=1 Tax=Rhizobium leguminosarum TaxID=384 RepID=A0A7M3DNZ3_RHILE|nr:plastocyanin/azurin family copper-binding protein [Rhizobium leguminosarum]NKK41798.1 hypothetical protein [Rhizobium leguminosarum bv. viciae]TAY50359.1 hypothetical protein ELH90_00845 [Rhizobium leguminosarum]
MPVVEISQFKYNPPDLVIEVGDAVEWINRDASGHTATRIAAPTFDTGPLARNETSRAITFPSASDAAGFEYFCSPHPFMKGRIIVTLPGTNSASYSLSAATAHHEHLQSEE